MLRLLRVMRDHKSYRELSLVSLVSFLFGIIYGLFSFYLPIFVEDIVKNIALAGVFLALVEVAGLLFDLPIGAFTDRYGRRRTILLGALLLALAALFFEAWQTILGLAVTLIFYGIVIEFIIIANDAELMAVSPRRRSGRFFGIYEALHNFGYSIGPFIGGVLLAFANPPVFWALIILCLLLFFFVLFFMEKRELKHGSMIETAGAVIKKDHFFESSIREFKKIGIEGWLLSLFYFTFAFRWGAIALLVPIFALRLGLDPLWVGAIYGASTLPFLFVSPLAGIFTDRYGIKPAIVFSLFLMGSATFLFGTTGNPYVLFAYAFIAAIGDAILVPTILAGFDTLSSRHFKGRISSVVNVVEDLGYLTAPLIAGFLAHFLGFATAFSIFGSFILAVTIVSIFVRITRH